MIEMMQNESFGKAFRQTINNKMNARQEQGKTCWGKGKREEMGNGKRSWELQSKQEKLGTKLTVRWKHLCQMEGWMHGC